jgi:hypothetical protein
MIPTFALLTQAASNLPSDASALERSISALESCISALDSTAESLGNSAASLEPWSWVFTALVAVGVAMEFWVIWHEHREDTETWALTFFGVHRTLRPHFGRLIAEYISVALVAGGIIGELVVGIKIASFNTQWRVVDSQLRSKNAELRGKSDQLVALLGKAAEDERLARVEIEASVAWRSLSRDDKKNIGDALRRFPETVVYPEYERGDVEASAFVADIASALAAASWTVHPPGEMVNRSFPNSSTFTPTSGPLLLTGVRIEPSKKGHAAAVALRNELCQRGFDATLSPNESDDSIPLIVVGVDHRPNGPQGKFKVEIEANNAKQSAKP